jgi:serine/threonine-protein kinase RsbW
MTPMPPDSNAGRPENELSELLNIGFPADPEAIGTVADAITETLIRLQVPEQKRLEIGLAVQEALVNAVVHGCKNNPSKEVRCRLQSDPLGRIVITVTDPGPGFSPNLLSDPRRQENLYADHGRGVYLIRQLMDEVSFERRGNEIRMWKY